MAEITTKPRPAAKTPATNQRGIPTARLASVVDRTSKLSDEVLKSVEEGERAAIEAAGRFLVTVEEALPQEVEGTSEVAQKITESGLEMADRLGPHVVRRSAQGHRQHCQVGEHPQRSKARRCRVSHRPHNSRRTGPPLVLGAGCAVGGAWLAGHLHVK
jgi:hypothetical protein